MPIELDSPTAARIPVLRHKVMGERCVAMLIDTPQQRDILKKNTATGAMEPVAKPGGGNRQELVLKLMVVESTMNAALGEDVAVPQPGDIVRLILKGKAFSQYIDAKNSLGGGHVVGDIVVVNTTNAQAYDAQGAPTGPPITTQEEANAVPRERTLGFYGDLVIARAGAEHVAWVAKAEAAHMAQKQSIALEAEQAAQGQPQPVGAGVGATAGAAASVWPTAAAEPSF